MIFRRICRNKYLETSYFRHLHFSLIVNGFLQATHTHHPCLSSDSFALTRSLVSNPLSYI